MLRFQGKDELTHGYKTSKDSSEMEKRSYKWIRRLEAVLARKAKRVTIDESVGGADGTSTHCDAMSDRADDNLCVTAPGGRWFFSEFAWRN